MHWFYSVLGVTAALLVLRSVIQGAAHSALREREKERERETAVDDRALERNIRRGGE